VSKAVSSIPGLRPILFRIAKNLNFYHLSVVAWLYVLQYSTDNLDVLPSMCIAVECYVKPYY
jgi:hypothetical protein